LAETGAWVKEAHRVLDLVEQEAGEEGNIDLVLFLLQGCEGGHDVGFLVGQENRLCRDECNLVSVLVRHGPAVLNRNTRIVLDDKLLMRGHTNVRRGEEKFLLGEADLGSIAEALQLHLLKVVGGVIEEELRVEVVETSAAGVELVADEAEGLARDKADWGECLKGVRRVLKYLELNGGVTFIGQLDSLVDGLTRSACLERHFLGAHFDHGDEGLGARSKGMATEANHRADRRVNLFVSEVEVFRLGLGAKKSLCLGLCALHSAL